MNHELAAKVLDKIISYPDNFYMGSWVGEYDSFYLSHRSIPYYCGADPTVTDQECDTTMCVAGWAAFLTTGLVNSSDVREIARTQLDISEQLASALFHATSQLAIEALEVMNKPESTEQNVLDVLTSLDIAMRSL